MALGKRLKEARKKRELTQEELAEKVFDSRDTKWQAQISALETRDSETSTHLFAFADALNVRPRWLQTGDGPSGLEDPLGEIEARMLGQLIDLWTQLDADRRHRGLSYINTLHAKQYPAASASNPFGRKRSVARAQTTAKAKVAR